jgi:hypothetical protein
MVIAKARQKRAVDEEQIAGLWCIIERNHFLPLSFALK